MAYPEHPEIIIVKNTFYPKGLREIDIWNYYQKVKTNILSETRNFDVMFFIMTGDNIIVKRKIKDEYIRLRPDNYDTIITGRTISIHSTMPNYSSIGIVDIDCDDFRVAKITTLETYEVLLNSQFIRKAHIRFTGKSSFHIACTFARSIKIDSIRFLLERYLKSSPLAQKYTIQAKREKNIPNLDLWASNKYKGNFITLYSLSIIGLRCVEVPYNEIMKFRPEYTKI